MNFNVSNSIRILEKYDIESLLHIYIISNLSNSWQEKQLLTWQLGEEEMSSVLHFWVVKTQKVGDILFQLQFVWFGAQQI